MLNKEHLNEKIAQTERILKWIKALNDSDKHEELKNAIWFLQHFTQDIHYLWSEITDPCNLPYNTLFSSPFDKITKRENTDSAVRFDKGLIQSFAQGELSYELQQMRQFNKTDLQLPKE